MTLVQTEPKKITMRTASRLPAEYQEVEYIENTGATGLTYQYIDTGVTINVNTNVSIELGITPNTSYISENAVLGTDWSGSTYFLMFYSSKWRWHSMGGNVDNSVSPTATNHTVILTNNSISVDGTTSSFTKGNSYDGTGSILLFAVRGFSLNPSRYKPAVFKCHGMKMHDGNSLVRDFVPCYRKSDNVIGMYDLVNDVFYTNQGSGTFTKGNDVNFVEQEIKRVTIRPNGQEKQIRPVISGWRPGANTIAYWELNGNGNDTKNNYGVTTYTTTNYNATGYVGAGNPTYLTQRKGKYCAYFDNDRALQLPVLPIPSNNLTFSFWVNFTTISTSPYYYHAVFQLREDVSDLGDGWALGLCTKQGGIYVRIVATTYSTGATGVALLETGVHTINTGNWYNVVVTFNAGTVKLYINGTLVETNGTNNYLRNTNSSPSYIGGWYNRKYSEIEYFNGYVQDVIYENKVWSAAEVSDYYTLEA